VLGAPKPMLPSEAVCMLPSGGCEGGGSGRNGNGREKRKKDSPLSPIEPAPFRKMRPRSPVPYFQGKNIFRSEMV